MKAFFEGLINVLLTIGGYLTICFCLVLGIILVPVMVPAVLLCALLDNNKDKGE